MSTSSSSKMIVLKSSDGERFEVEETVALQSETIKTMIEACGTNNIPGLPNVTTKTLAKVIEYCKRHAGNDNDKDDDLNFDKEFVNVDKDLLLHLVSAANYLEIRGLLHLTCLAVADKITGMSPEEIRKFFGISSSTTPKEEEEKR